MTVKKVEGSIRFWNPKGGWGTIGYCVDGILFEAWTSFVYFIEVLQKGDIVPLGTKVLFTLHANRTGRLPVGKNIELLGPVEHRRTVEFATASASQTEVK